MKNKTLTVAVLVLAALLSTTTFAQRRGGGMGSSGGFRSSPAKSYSPSTRTYSPPARTYSPPAQTYTPPVTRPSGGMGASGSFKGTINSTPSTKSGTTGGMGTSGTFKSPGTGTTSTTTTRQSPSLAPRSSGSTSTTHVYSIGSRPPSTVHYSRTVIVDGRTRYIYPDGSYSFDPTGVIIGYMAYQNAQNAYQQGVNDANYNNQVAQGYVPTAPRTVVVQQGPGAGIIVLWVVIGVIAVVGALALWAKFS